MPRRKPAPNRNRKSSPNSTAQASVLRVIGGEWRSRKLSFFPAEGLRPTLDRVRETAFNWLAPYMEGAECLDLFAGSGALTFEALSRGASHVHINELNQQVRNTLANQLALLECPSSRYTLTGIDGASPTNSFERSFDVIFLDPPFRQDLLEQCCQQLEQLGLFKPRCQIYIESEIALEQLALPVNWQITKQKKAGQTHYGLIEAA